MTPPASTPPASTPPASTPPASTPPASTPPAPGAPTDDRRLVSARLLTDLVADTLDSGYRAAHERRAGTGTVGLRWYDRPLAALGCLLIGMVTAVAYVHTHRGAPAAAGVHERLVERVRTAQQAGTDLVRRAAQTQRQLTAVRNAALPASAPLAQQLRRAQLAAGDLAVHGPGITVTLRDAPAGPTSAAPRAGTVPIIQGSILTDRDLRSVVDELWHDGAEAIAVNGVRLTPTSAIRFAGQAVLVDREPLTSPYRIDAVGDAGALLTSFTQSAVAARYQTLVDATHLGFSIDESPSLHLAAGAPVTPRYARTPGPARAHR